tara:strand:+ start:372 stop:911 length:540 start_codon:yes stop_codon:yes gene_type:complete
MSGWLYLIKNGDLYKIGITKNIENRMRQLKPDLLVSKLYSKDFRKLEREFHKRYKNVRIPQTEYFRLDNKQIKDIKQRIRKFNYPFSITFGILINSFCILLLLSLLVIFFTSLTNNDIENILFISLHTMEKISFIISFLYLFIKSDMYLSFMNELKFRSSRVIIFILFGLIFRFASIFH